MRRTIASVERGKCLLGVFMVDHSSLFSPVQKSPSVSARSKRLCRRGRYAARLPWVGRGRVRQPLEEEEAGGGDSAG